MIVDPAYLKRIIQERDQAVRQRNSLLLMIAGFELLALGVLL